MVVNAVLYSKDSRMLLNIMIHNSQPISITVVIQHWHTEEIFTALSRFHNLFIISKYLFVFYFVFILLRKKEGRGHASISMKQLGEKIQSVPQR